MRVVFVHGACVKDGAWWWHRTDELLREHGITSAAALMPSCGETGVPGGANGLGLSEDVAAVRQLLLDDDEPTIVVGHSYGGIVASQAAAGISLVRHLLYISSYLPEIGQSLSDFGGEDGPAPFLDLNPQDGTFGVRPELLADTFLQDCGPAIREEAQQHLTRQSMHVLAQGVDAAAWHDVPSTYLVCTDDRGTPVASQREFARRAGGVVELNSGHHPFLSHPEAVRDLVLSLRSDT